MANQSFSSTGGAAPTPGATVAFKTLATTGQSDIVADSATDILTLSAMGNFEVHHHASTDTVILSGGTGAGGGGSGDITGVTITTDTGGGSKAEDTAGSADFSIVGGTGAGVTNSGTTITIASEDSEIDHDALSNFVANEHIDWTASSAGTVHATNYTDTDTTYTAGNGITLNTAEFDIDAAQTTITSIYATDLILGEDSETAIDFGTVNEIRFNASNQVQMKLADGVFQPISDSDVDLGTTSVRWKDAYVDSITVSDTVSASGSTGGSVYGSSVHWTYVAENSGSPINFDTKDIYTTISSDVNYGDVIVMLHFEDTNGATSTTDDSFNMKAITFTGTSQISTVQKKFGSSSLLLDGNSDYLSIADASDLDLGTSDFTIECWFYYDDASSGTYATIFDRGNGNSSGTGPFWMAVKEDSGTYALVGTCASDGGAGNDVFEHYDAADITNNTWTHIAFARDGSDFYTYINGTATPLSGATASAVTDNNYPILIGARGQSGTGSYWGGYIDEFRMTVGTCRYPAGTPFTPSTTAFSGENRYQQTVVTGISGSAVPSDAEANEFSFKTISTTGQSDIVADTSTDTLTVSAMGDFEVHHHAASDTLILSGGPGAPNEFSFKTISTTGQTDIVADTSTDTLNVSAMGGFEVHHHATTDTLILSGGPAGSSQRTDFEIMMAAEVFR
jgi:hypothetical protein